MVRDFVGVDFASFPFFLYLCVKVGSLLFLYLSLSSLFPFLGEALSFPVKNPDVDGMILIPVHSQGSDVPVWATRP